MEGGEGEEKGREVDGAPPPPKKYIFCPRSAPAAVFFISMLTSPLGVSAKVAAASYAPGRLEQASGCNANNNTLLATAATRRCERRRTNEC